MADILKFKKTDMSVLQGKYTFKRELGDGAWGKVYEVRDKNNVKYAAKIVHGDMKMFLDEAKAADLQPNDHLVHCIEANSKGSVEKRGITKEVAYILLEYVGGGMLLQALMNGGPLSEKVSRTYLK